MKKTNIKKSSHAFFINFSKKNQIKINYEGKVFKVLPESKFNLICLYLVVLALTTVLFSYISNLKYYNVTVTGNTIYSKVAAYIIKKNKTSIAFCKDIKVRRYYDTCYGEIPIDNPKTCFLQREINNTKLIKLTSDDIKNLEYHTKLDGLTEIQDKIITKFYVNEILNEPNEGHVLSQFLKDVIDIPQTHGKIVNVKPFFNKLYCVETNDEFWVTKILIDDNTEILNKNDTIVTNVSNISNEVLTIDKFYVCDNFDIIPLNEDLDKWDFVSPFYGLKSPRSFHNENIYKINPLHFPFCKDVFLTIMIITLRLTI